MKRESNLWPLLLFLFLHLSSLTELQDQKELS